MFTDTGGTTPVVANNDVIVRMANKAGGALFQGITSPLYKTALVNGNSAGAFVSNAYSQRTADQTLASFISASAYTLIVVVRINNVVATGTTYNTVFPIFGDVFQRISLGYSTASGGSFVGYQLDTSAAEDYAINSGHGQNTWYVVTMQKTGGTMRVRVNQGLWANVSTNNLIATNGLMVLGDLGGVIAGDVDYLHFAVYNSAIADADIDDVELYLATTAGITL
jgi:hypothetical protein